MRIRRSSKNVREVREQPYVELTTAGSLLTPGGVRLRGGTAGGGGSIGTGEEERAKTVKRAATSAILLWTCSGILGSW